MTNSNQNISRAEREETGLSTENPIRGERESDTYWHTRFLTHSILGQHYRTPQMNSKLLMDYLNSRLPTSKTIKRVTFAAPGNSNLNFYMRNHKISFSAHEPISKEEFHRRFELE
jgi:hypothetical protein